MADPKPSLRTAIHEAGHALSMHKLGRRIVKASVVPSEDLLGYVAHAYSIIRKGDDPEWHLTPRLQRRIEEAIIVCLAGPAAELHHLGGVVDDEYEGGGSDDRRKALMLADLVSGGDLEQSEKYLAWLQYRAEALVTSDQSWVVVSALADRLLQQREMSGPQVKRAIYDSYAELIRQATSSV